MKSLLLTGGTGFFGRAILRYLISVKQTNGRMPFGQVTVMSRSPENFHLRYPGLTEMSWLNWHKGNVLDSATFPQNANFDFILHAASDSTNNAAPTPLQTFQQIVDGTQNSLSFATQCGAKRFLLTSSGGAYGPQPSQIESIPETYMGMPDSLNPANAYGVAKRQAEHLCALYGHQHGIETVVARCFAFVGEDLPRDAHFAIGNFIRDALERPEIVVNGNGSPIRSYMHQNDLAHWLLTLLQSGKAGDAYNVGSDEAVSIEELAYLVRDTLSPQKKVQINGELLADNVNRSRYIPDILKAQNELGLKVTVPLADAIRLSVPGYMRLK